MSKPAGRDLPAYIRAEFIPNMVLAVRREQFTIEQAMQEVARECLAHRTEGAATGAALAMESAPTIKDMIMRRMRDHYWDSLEPQRELVLKHIEGALRLDVNASRSETGSIEPQPRSSK